MHLKESGQGRKKNKKQRASPPRKLSLTPEIQALYFQCLAGKLHGCLVKGEVDNHFTLVDDSIKACRNGGAGHGAARAVRTGC